MNTPLFTGRERIRVAALNLGERIDLKPLRSSGQLAAAPLVVEAGEGNCVVLFRFGVAVFVGMTPVEQVAYQHHLASLVQDPYDDPPGEELWLRIEPGGNDRIEQNEIVLSAASIERIQVVASVLGKSVILERYENVTRAEVEHIEELAGDLKKYGRARLGQKALLQYIGDLLTTEHKMVNRVEVGEKPEMLWEHPELEPLYVRLEREYELADRRIALENKLKLVSRTVETALDLLNNRRSLRVEWYIVILIVIEIFITLFELTVLRH